MFMEVFHPSGSFIVKLSLFSLHASYSSGTGDAVCGWNEWCDGA